PTDLDSRLRGNDGISVFDFFCFWGMTGFEIEGIYQVKRKLNVAKIYPKSQQLFRVIPAKAGI
ncbi:hypothetical protein ACNPJN_09675, partial [Neisseria meningitidis]|uniref:hypothetical protein n=1 Tax=Neisseria meningitidis TaxID=487 RepID=UPI003AAB9F20